MADHSKPSCEQIIDIIPDPFVVIDRNYRIVAANRNYRERYGMHPEDVVGRRCHEVSHHSDVPCSQNGEHCPLDEILISKQATQVMHVHFHSDGQEEYVQLHASPLLENGEVRYIGETIFPVTPPEGDGDDLLIGRSMRLLRMLSLLQRVAPTQTTVLLLGESGVGKEQVAKYLHRYSQCNKRPFVVIDCGALGESLIESELFGHEKGSFTGAIQRKKGLFEAAQGGTLFIDEIGELPMSLQTKLLRALETGTIRRIGGTDYINVSARIIAATNRDIKEMVAQGTFRQDLYYRLSAFPVEVPALRERKDDVPMLAEYFLARIDNGKRHIPLAPEVIETLLSYDYPGNVRELRNIVERATILAGGDALAPRHFSFEHKKAAPSQAGQSGTSTFAERRSGRLDNDQIVRALEQAQGHRAHAAKLLGISERTLYRLIARLQVQSVTAGSDKT
ncbi:MAG: sigma 54-interacting transcriptional regulator [Gammaproteobacteria bacterium]|nr:sigma 54-interacting transcriptional regulator [Gammaproteobacteria bacterium]